MREDQRRHVRGAGVEWALFVLGSLVGAAALATALLVTRNDLMLYSTGPACSVAPVEAYDLPRSSSGIQIVVLTAAVITIVAVTAALVRAVAGRSIWWISFAGTGLFVVIVTALNLSIVF